MNMRPRRCPPAVLHGGGVRDVRMDRESKEQFEIDVSGHGHIVGESDSLNYFKNLVTLPDDLVNPLLQKKTAPLGKDIAILLDNPEAIFEDAQSVF